MEMNDATYTCKSGAVDVFTPFLSIPNLSCLKYSCNRFQILKLFLKMYADCTLTQLGILTDGEGYEEVNIC